MNQNNKKSQTQSSLLVICHDDEDFKNVSEVLSHYFTNQNNPSMLLISNKYYRAEVRLHPKFWDHVFDQSGQSSISSKDEIKTTISKYDLMIMLVNEAQQNLVKFESLDSIIETFNPEEFVLLINTSTPEDPWVHEETILEKCNNFIEIVKEDLWKVNKTRPLWSRGALLNHEEESNDSGIFSILDRMETTRWSKMVNIKKDIGNQKKEQVADKLNSKSESNSKQLNTEPQQEKDKNKPSNESISINQNQDRNIQPSPLVNTGENSSSEEETDEKKLEEEMKEFENMMSQMMSFKMQSAGMKIQERKQKAQKLFFTIFKGVMKDQN